MSYHNQLDPSEDMKRRRRELIIGYNRKIAASALKYYLNPAIDPYEIFTYSIIKPSLPVTHLDIMDKIDPHKNMFIVSSPDKDGVVDIKLEHGFTPNQAKEAGEMFADMAPHLQTIREIIDNTNSHLASGGEGGVEVGKIKPFDSPLTRLMHPGTRVLSDAYSLSADRYRLNPFDINTNKSNFHKTPVARNLLTRAKEIGISISSRAQDDILFPTNPKQGEPYSKLSRALCHAIQGYYGDDIQAEGDMRPTGDGPTDLLLSLAHQIKRRDHDKHPGNELNHDYDGGVVDNCSEAEKFFVDYINHGKPKVRKMLSSNVRFITKEPEAASPLSFGAPTSLNLDPVMFRGVQIPPGFIFSAIGFTPLRASAFCFDYDTAVSTFGWQLTRSGPEAKAAFDRFAKLRDDKPSRS